MEQVLAQDELLQPILRHAGKKLEDLLNIRRVCHRWRLLAFTTFLETNQRLVNIHLCDFSRLDNRLTPICCVPLSIRHDGITLTFNEIRFLQDYGHNIVEIWFGGTHRELSKCNVPIPNFNWNLSNLQVLKVFSPEDQVYYTRDNGFSKLINIILKKANRLKSFQMSLDIYTDEVNIFSNLLPHGITHLNIGFSSSKLENLDTLFSINNWECLVDLEMGLAVDQDQDNEAKNDIISQIINKYGKGLNRLKVEQFLSPVVTIKLGKLEALRELHLTRINIGIQGKNLALSTLLPRLVSLKLEGNAALINELERFTGYSCRFDKLQVLSFNIDQEGEQTVDKHFGATFLRILQACVTVKILRWDYLSPNSASVILPFVFSQLTKLTCLDIKINHNDKDPEALSSRDIGCLLTGLRSEETPVTETSFPGILDGKKHAMTNLTNLREFSLSSNKMPCQFGAFIFKAVFLRISTLEKLVLMGDTVQVDEFMQREWNAVAGKTCESENSYIELPSLNELKLQP